MRIYCPLSGINYIMSITRSQKMRIYCPLIAFAEVNQKLYCPFQPPPPQVGNREGGQGG